MAQLRQHYPEIKDRGAEVIVISPDAAGKLRGFWQEHSMPFPGLPDPRSRVAVRFNQQYNLLKMGRMPLLLIVDRDGRVRYRHSGQSMSDIPGIDEVLQVLDQLAADESRKEA